MGRKNRETRSRPASPEPLKQPRRAAPAAGSTASSQASGASPSTISPEAWTIPPQAWTTMLVLVVVAFAVYLGALGTPFLLDDPLYITKSTAITRPVSLGALLRDPRALVTLTLRWNYLAGGFEVGGYHLLNVTAHALTGCLLFLLAFVTLRLETFAERLRSNAVMLAAIVAAVFLLHPMQTESVTYVIQRAEVFVSAALLASLLALTRMGERTSGASLAMLAVSCLVGIYSKPSFVVVPGLLFVYDFCTLANGRIAAMKARWPAYAIASAAAVITFLLTNLSGTFDAATTGFDIEGITPGGYFAAQLGILVHYLRVALWPVELCFDCGYRGPWPVLNTFLGDSVVLPGAILAVIAAAALAFWKKQPLLAFAVFGSAVVLSPTSTFVPLADFYVEHRMYLPIAFLAMALVPAAFDLTERIPSRIGIDSQMVRTARAAAAVTVLVALAAGTIARNRMLADPIALMEDALEQAPQNERVHYNLANAYKRTDRLDDAVPHYEAAIRLLPNVVRSYENLGSLYLQQGKLEEALKVFEAGAAAKPQVGMAHRNVASTFLRLGKAQQALAPAEQAMRVEPGHPNSPRLLGDVLMALGRTGEAVEAWRAGLSAYPNDSGFKERLAKAGAR